MKQLSRPMSNESKGNRTKKIGFGTSLTNSRSTKAIVTGVKVL